MSKSFEFRDIPKREKIGDSNLPRLQMPQPTAEERVEAAIRMLIQERGKAEENRRPWHELSAQEKDAAFSERCLAVAAHGLGPRRPIPRNIVEESQKVLDARRVNEKPALTPEQLASVKKIEQLVLTGDLAGLTKCAQPDQSVINTVSKDLNSIGIDFKWENKLVLISSEQPGRYPNVGISFSTERPENPAGSVRYTKLVDKEGQLGIDFKEQIVDSRSAAFDIAITANARASRQKPK
jgi:hypothetical protein